MMADKGMCRANFVAVAAAGIRQLHYDVQCVQWGSDDDILLLISMSMPWLCLMVHVMLSPPV
jgi:hypothetical protein